MSKHLVKVERKKKRAGKSMKLSMFQTEKVCCWTLQNEDMDIFSMHTSEGSICIKLAKKYLQRRSVHSMRRQVFSVGLPDALSSTVQLTAPSAAAHCLSQCSQEIVVCDSLDVFRQANAMAWSRNCVDTLIDSCELLPPWGEWQAAAWIRSVLVAIV